MIYVFKTENNKKIVINSETRLDNNKFSNIISIMIHLFNCAHVYYEIYDNADWNNTVSKNNITLNANDINAVLKIVEFMTDKQIFIKSYSESFSIHHKGICINQLQYEVKTSLLL